MSCKDSRSSVVLGKSKEKLMASTVVVIGLGGTGSTVANLLARQGVGKLILIDGDVVEESNLERQILYDKEDIGEYKAQAAKEKLEPFANVAARIEDIDSENIDIVGEPELIIDCTDNTKTRLVIDDYCKDKQIPWIHTGAVGKMGLVYLITPEGPKFRDFNQENEGQKCAQIGVMNSIVNLISSLAVSIATDFLALEKIEKDMIRINLENNSFMNIKICKKK